MKIELSSPYKELYKSAYIRSLKCGRKVIDLFNSNNDRTTVSNARYLMSCQIGRLLTAEEEVDHKDEDKTNDSLDNLQVLSKEEHRLKTAANRAPRKQVPMSCSYCGEEFFKFENHIKPGQTVFFCSRSCNAKNSRQNGWTGKI